MDQYVKVSILDMKTLLFLPQRQPIFFCTLPEVHLNGKSRVFTMSKWENDHILFSLLCIWRNKKWILVVHNYFERFRYLHQSFSGMELDSFFMNTE